MKKFLNKSLLIVMFAASSLLAVGCGGNKDNVTNGSAVVGNPIAPVAPVNPVLPGQINPNMPCNGVPGLVFNGTSCVPQGGINQGFCNQWGIPWNNGYNTCVPTCPNLMTWSPNGGYCTGVFPQVQQFPNYTCRNVPTWSGYMLQCYYTPNYMPGYAWGVGGFVNFNFRF